MLRMRNTLLLILVMSLAGCAVDGLPQSLSPRERATVYEAVIVHQRAVQLYEQGNLPDAIVIAEKAVELLVGALDVNHPLVAVPLNSLAVFHHLRGDYATAEPLYRRVIEINSKVLGAGDLELAPYLDQLAALYREWGEYAKAEPLYARALAIRQRKLKPTDPELAENLNNLAMTFEQQGEYRRAEPLYLRALAIAEGALGPSHPDVARGLDGLAMLYWAQGTYARAEPLLVRSLSIRVRLEIEIRTLGPAKITQLAGNLLDSLGDSFRDSFRSGSYLKRAGRPSPYALPLRAYASLIANLNSAALESISNLDQLRPATIIKSEPVTSRTADVFESVLQTARADVAESIDNLALLYVAKGEYRRAEPLLLRTLDAREKALGVKHPGVANSLSNLAQLYQTQGAYAKAEPLLQRVVEIKEKSLGAAHPEVARSLNNLALLYAMQGEPARAESLLVRAVTLLEDALGEWHPDVARSLNNLALVYHHQGEYSMAEPLYTRAIDIVSKTPAGAHPDTVRYLNNLAVLHHANGEHEQAQLLMARAASMRESQLPLELTRLSAPRKRALMGLLQQETESLVSLHADTTPGNVRAFDLALTTILRRKGLALESLLDNQATLRAHLSPAIRQKLDQHAAASTEISTLMRTPVASDVASRASEVAALRSRIDTLESELNAASAALRARSHPVTPAQIQAALPYGVALVEFVRYRRFDPRSTARPWHEPRYVAYVLQRKGQPQWVALGEAKPIDAAIDAVLAQMHRNAHGDATRATLQHLDGLVFAPVRDRLAGVSHVIVSPDGKLNLVPFEALVDSEGRYELEHRLVSYVTSGRDLLQLGARREPRSPATIVGAPDYGPGNLFGPLPGASSEVIEVSAYFPGATVLSGGEVTKAALAALAGPAVLHVATHGFYARDTAARPTPAPVTVRASAAPLPTPDMLERGMFVESELASLMLREPADALDRTGLALAGANVDPNGIVTAREIATYDWWGTQLVVLSACETGVGAVSSGEGVYGMRRALALAGSASHVVSLWNLSDSSARMLMREFYRELARGTGRAEALRRAKLWMVKQPKVAHPYYWAAFIPAGDWRPIDRKTMRRPGRTH